ncbi:MAG: mediator complex subunit [Thelocarpon superellum]|nr:MAG: mediator complex subunit [Thelocarpon superellum]
MRLDTETETVGGVSPLRRGTRLLYRAAWTNDVLDAGDDAPDHPSYIAPRLATIDCAASYPVGQEEGLRPHGDVLALDEATDEMPGMRVENGAARDDDGAQDPTHRPHSPKSSLIPNGFMPKTESPQLAKPVANGRHVNANEEGVIEGADGTFAVAKDPPYIERVDGGEYKDLAELTVRLVQETLNELKEVIHALADMSAPHATHQSGLHDAHALVNGNAAAQVSVQKKTRLMDFVQHRRAQFIKLLVLASWSRSTEDVRKAIDLLQWLRTQAYLHDEASLELGRLKLSMGPAKLPNPDLATALEVLSTGTASWLPDLNLIPAPPLSPHETLKTLRNINTLLAIRLNLHEDLPPYFQTFTIASGRATFVVPGEFEVDLSIADEDPTKQLYFLDLRFLFASDPDALQGRLRHEIEERANEVLKTDGLRGCYDFLHELVLTHKINVLRRQAAELVRGRWADAVRLEMVRRTLVVQYWLKRPGGKSWIEIGVRRKAAQADGISRPATSAIAIRWVRDGKEAAESPLALPTTGTSMEALLKRVIALHTNSILRAIRDKLLEAPLYAHATLSLSLSTSAVASVQSKVTAQLTPSRTATLTMEPIGGRFALEPATLRFSQVEHTLNSLKDPATEAPHHLSNLRCLIVKEEIESRARCVGWQLLRTLSPKQEDMKRVFPRDTLQVSYFSRTGWNGRWVVALSVGMGGEDWWILELLPATIGHAIGDHQRLPIAAATARSIDPTYEYLGRLERISAGMISLFVHARQLQQSRIRYAVRAGTTDGDPTDALPLLVIRFSSLIGHGLRRRLQTWAKEPVQVKYQGVTSSTGHATQIMVARLVQPALFGMIRDRVDDDVVFHAASGTFACRLHGPVGESMVTQMRDRLVRIERLIRFLQVVRRFRLQCDSLSLGRLVFHYARDPPLRATVGFASQAPMTFTLEAGNPHLRIADFLTRILNGDGDAGLEHVTVLVSLTIPLFRALAALEATSTAHAASPTRVFILPRAADWLQLRYDAPRAFFDIRLRQRRDDIRWFISEDTATLASSVRDRADAPTARPAPLAEALRALMLDQGEGWKGLRTGIVATMDGVADALRRLDDVVRTAGTDASMDGNATTAAGHTVVIAD